MITKDDVRRWGGKDLLDPDGEKIGTIEDFYLAKGNMEPEWVVVKRDFLGFREKLVPFRAIEWREDYAISCYDKEQVTKAPGPGIDGRLSDEEELKLFDHYGLSREQPLRTEGGYAAEPVETAERRTMEPHGQVTEERDRLRDRESMEEAARRAHPLSTDLEEEQQQPVVPPVGLAGGTRPEPGERGTGHYREGAPAPEEQQVPGSSRLVRVKKYMVTERTERVPISEDEFEESGEERGREERPGEGRRAA